MSRLKFLAKWSRSPSWEDLSVHIRPDKPDQRIDLMPTRGSALGGLGFMAVWLGGVLFMIVYSDILETAFGFMHVILAIFVVAGIGGFASSVNAVFSNRKAVFGSEGVEVTGHSLFGREKWREAYSGYKGVLHRQVEVQRAKDGPHITYQFIELRHDEPDKILPLLVEESKTMPRAAWEAYAKWLELPALTETDGELVARDHEDLDKSIGELAAEGKIAPKLDFSDPPPAGLIVAKESAEDGDQLRVTLTVARVPIMVPVFLLGIPTLICLAVAMFLPLVALGALLFIGLGILWVVKDRRNHVQILVTREKLVVNDSWERRPLHEMSFDLGEIETITLDRNDGVKITSDRTQADVGSCLSQAAMIWLKDFLTSAVATA